MPWVKVTSHEPTPEDLERWKREREDGTTLRLELANDKWYEKHWDELFPLREGYKENGKKIDEEER